MIFIKIFHRKFYHIRDFYQGAILWQDYDIYFLFLKAALTINNFYLVFDYCNGGTISNCLDLFKKKFDKPFTEEVAQYILKKTVNGLYYLHKNKFFDY